MSRFLKKLSLLAFPLIAILVLVNYIGDSANLFKAGYELKMAQIVTDGKNVTNVDNYDERLFQKECIEQLKYKPSTVVLGASKAMQINGKMVQDSNFFNSTVSGASIEDYIAIYQIYKNNNKLPKKIIIDIEPYLFNNNANQERWKSIQSYYYQFKKEKVSTEKINKYNELISLSYFQSSIKNLYKVISGNGVPIATNEKCNSTFTKIKDGTICYDTAYRFASINKVDGKVNEYLSGDLYSIEDFNALEQKILKDFQSLIDDMIKNKINIEFFLCPHHPKVYDRIEKKYPMVLKTEYFISQYAKANNLIVRGTYNPYPLKLNKFDFYDGSHLKESKLDIVFNYLQ